MGQRYRVFLNDRVIEISEIINNIDNQPDEISIQYSDKKELKKEIERFILDPNCNRMNIFSAVHPSDSWKDFVSCFKYLEAAGGVVYNEKKEILFIRRFEKWDLPKGKIEKNEHPEEAAVREVEEETGLNQPAILHSLPDTYHLYPDRNNKFILKKTFWFRMSYYGSEALIPQLEEHITEARWISEKKLDEILTNTYASLKGLLEQL
ncbi:MAG: NUDIX domain-containing protein [Bacteroidales bacterium]|nr:NUDIX domain-containing protein [Bacteroidales bacterium]